MERITTEGGCRLIHTEVVRVTGSRRLSNQWPQHASPSSPVTWTSRSQPSDHRLHKAEAALLTLSNTSVRSVIRPRDRPPRCNL